MPSAKTSETTTPTKLSNQVRTPKTNSMQIRSKPSIYSNQVCSYRNHKENLDRSLRTRQAMEGRTHFENPPQPEYKLSPIPMRPPPGSFDGDGVGGTALWDVRKPIKDASSYTEQAPEPTDSETQSSGRTRTPTPNTQSNKQSRAKSSPTKNTTALDKDERRGKT